MSKYKHKEIEARWQKIWADLGVFDTSPEEMARDTSKPKFYLLEMLPYPSGDLHMGHMRNYTLGDAVTRYRRMKGFNVFHPIGWDAFGLPAENAAIKNKVHPQKWTLQNIERMKAQLKMFGFSYQWDSEIATCDPAYYRWNQWFFIQMFKQGLAYRKKGRVNWCPECATVLANEQVVDGCCWRHEETPVEQRDLEQWYLKITDYIEELLSDLDAIADNWPERVVTMQRNWIGKSTGAKVFWKIDGGDDSNDSIETFTTRIDTIYGVTAMLLAPAHPLVDNFLADDAAARNKVAELRRQTQRQQMTGEVEKKGIFTGHFVIHPLTGENIPIWVSNMVLMDYGTGAVQAVPAHDQRDFEFCTKYDLPIRVVIEPDDGTELGAALTEAYGGHGTLVDSGEHTGLASREALRKITSDLEPSGQAKSATQYRLKDWCLSRQRFWGTPIPMLYCEKCGIVPVPEDQLPVVLPMDVEFGAGELSPLQSSEEFVHAECPACGGPARRETDTMDTFVDSAWYFYRYLSPRKDDAPFDSAVANHFFPIDQYIGGVEHATLHLIYCRFWTKVMRQLGLVNHNEPIGRLYNQGMVYKDGAKMSKSKGNVVPPDEMVEKYGCDTARLFEMFAGPPGKDMEWSQSGVEGCNRFLSRLFRLVDKHAVRLKNSDAGGPAGQADRQLLRKAHQTTKRVSDAFEGRWHFNTSIAAVMELVNEIYLLEPLEENVSVGALKDAVERAILLISPFAPHIAEELAEKLGHDVSIAEAGRWPDYDAELAKEDEFEMVIQINGKVRGKLTVSADHDEEAILALAKAEPRIASNLKGRTIRKTIVIPKKLVNIVVST